MASRLAQARDTLHTALSHVFDQPVPIQDGDPLQFSAERVHAYPPQTVVAPCVWVEQPRGGENVVGDLGTVLVDDATFPVAVVYDGSDRAQVAGLDELVARVWDAARTVGHPIRFEPGPLDVGGPNLRATFVDVDMRIAALTLWRRRTDEERRCNRAVPVEDGVSLPASTKSAPATWHVEGGAPARARGVTTPTTRHRSRGGDRHVGGVRPRRGHEDTDVPAKFARRQKTPPPPGDVVQPGRRFSRTRPSRRPVPVLFEQTRGGVRHAGLDDDNPPR